MINRIPSSPPIIQPITDGGHRPKWSVMIPTFNCIYYLRETIESVLAQGYDEDQMQIEVVDDFSIDGDVAALVKELGKGRVKFFQQETNLGSLRNFETCVNRARGYYVHILHGDDISINGFYKEVESLFETYPEIGAAFTDYEYIDYRGEKMWENTKIDSPKGVVNNWLLTISKSQLVQPPAMVIKRSTYEKLGSFFAVHYGEDWEMWTRVAANFPVAYSPNVLAKYRNHNSNISSRSLLSGQNIKDILTVINIVQDYLPDTHKKNIKRESKRNFSQYYARFAHKLYHDYNNQKAALSQVNGSLQLSINRTTIVQALKLYIKVLINYKKLKSYLFRNLRQFFSEIID